MVAGTSAQVYLLYLAWFNLLFDFHFFLASKAGAGMGRLGTLINLPIMIIAAINIPSLAGGKKAWMLCMPMLVLLLVGVINVPTAENFTYAKDALKILLLFYTIVVASAALIKTPKQALPLVFIFLLRFGWFEMFAKGSGLVPWHPTLSNYDGYGGLMVGAAGACYWAALGATTKRDRMLLYIMAALGVFGVVASAARGAFLALVVVAAIIWLRSPRKVVTALVMVAGVIVVFAGSSLLFEENFFWEEMKSAFSEGNDEGTGKQRWSLWVAAFRVWQEHPLFGVGPSNVGAFAAGYFAWGEIEMFENPAMFYGFNLHNAYMQILSEYGAVGMVAFIWLHVDFFKRNRALREPEALAAWNAGGGGRAFDLRYLSMALEAMLIALMLANILYASLLESWLWMTFGLNRVLWSVTRNSIGPPQPAVTARRTAAGASVRTGRGSPRGPPRFRS